MTKSYEFPVVLSIETAKRKEEKTKSEQQNQSPRQTTTELSNGRQLYYHQYNNSAN